eukprot:CAMPEP_0184670044 /NCGR_PEP_ID=MMETSP0308-20130426/80330_1 /TAXON_ID=38269 /ORGANISM="Gloeochaete witrockiana, Strain SAG 46.84" /LENGTH=39 /DNA_ID= /DNA_START= /DNA_END= /DNA_ORIENTATION=
MFSSEPGADGRLLEGVVEGEGLLEEGVEGEVEAAHDFGH